MISNGGTISSVNGYVGYSSDMSSTATISGSGSTWKVDNYFGVGSRRSNGTLAITDGGLVSVGKTLTVYYNASTNSFINMSTGGMLALHGEAGGSLASFLGLIDGTDAIRYWDDSISDWTDITSAVEDEDYTLNYQTEGDLAGYTVLTVGVVPEPSMLVGLLGLCLAGLFARPRRKR